MMNQYSHETNQQLLQNLMDRVQIADINELSRVAGVSRLQVIRIQRGLILNLSAGAIAKIAQALNISVDRLLAIFTGASTRPSDIKTELTTSNTNEALAACRQEYQQLQQELLQQRELLATEFQQSSLTTIESWLLQWPTAVAAVNKNPQLPATRLLPLVEPVEQLLQAWQVTAIGIVGEQTAYDPQYHQLIKGTAQPDEIVEVRYVGYKQRDRLLYKAKVSPVGIRNEE